VALRAILDRRCARRKTRCHGNDAAERSRARVPNLAFTGATAQNYPHDFEKKLFSFITINWRGKPLRTYRTIVQLIAATTTEAGLKVRAELDEKTYPKGVKVSDAQLAAVNLTRHTFHGDWNYTIAPRRRAN
jgi:hypothetical protein